MKTYISVNEAANKWGDSPKYVSMLCINDKALDAKRKNNRWIIPLTLIKTDNDGKTTRKNTNTFIYLLG